MCSLTVICGFIISVLLDDALRSARAHSELPKMECIDMYDVGNVTIRDFKDFPMQI